MSNTIKRTIIEVLNIENGQRIDANEFFKKPLDEITVYRSELQKAIDGFRPPLFKCYYCKQLIRIRGGKSEPNKRKTEIFHFAHLKDSDDCHIKTNNQFTKEEVDRIKYNGAKESILHQSIKENIAECLSRNQYNNRGISQIEVERIISDKAEKEWKKPDINAYFNGKRIAIELQLSTTWLDVITRRQHFYKEQGIYILWIFNEFNINDDVRRLTFNDVIYTNNQNAYVFDDEMYEKSIAENDLVIKCFYKTYFKNRYNEIEEDWDYSFIRLSDLTFDEKNFRIFYHNAEKQKREVENDIKRQKKIDEIAHREHVRKMNEEMQLKEKHDQEQKEKKRNIETTISDLTSEIDGIKDLLKEYSEKKSILTKKHKEKNESIRDIAGLTERTIKHLSDGLNFYKPFYDNEHLLEKMRTDFREKLIKANQTQRSKIQEKETLLKRREQNLSLPVKHIASISYSILDKIKFGDFIQNNFSKVKVIHKDSIGNLFEADSIKLINSSSELLQYKISPNYLFIIDLSSAIKDLGDQIEKCEEIITKEKSVISSIKNEVSEILKTQFVSDIQELESNIEVNEINQNSLIEALNQKETELASNYATLSTIEVDQI